VATEQVQLDLAASPEDRVRLHLKFAHTRAIEFESLIIEQRFDLLPQTLAGMQSALGRARLMQNQIQGELPADIHESALSLEKTVHSQLVMMQFYAAPLPATLDAEMERVAWLASSQNYGSP
jgi:hypothetical protein